jgi:UDP-glucose 4-epimerase
MKILVAGGAGFIGGHMVDHLVRTTDARIVVFDNFTSGRMWHLEAHRVDPRVEIVRGDLKDRDAITAALAETDRVYHFASNPDIAKAMVEPDVDFWEGTYLTQNLLEAIRVTGVAELVYASGSGVYGDTGDHPVSEDHSPMLPISPYGASKLACEAMIHAYTHMFGLSARVFRFANVVGGRQTHGVAYDFIRRLRGDPTRLHILGDGRQTKSYIHVDDIVAGIQFFTTRGSGRYQYYQLATPDCLSVTEIADLVVEEMGLSNVSYDYGGGSRGWAGDVPVVRFDLTKVTSGGWSARHSAREAMRRSIRAMLAEPHVGPATS